MASIDMRLKIGFFICAAVVAGAIFGCFPDWDTQLEGSKDADTEDRNSDEPTTVTVCAYNVENFDLGGDADGQYDRIAEFVADRDVDILAVEEIQNNADGDDASLFGEALENASHPMPYSGMSAMSDGFNALGVWSRFPLSDMAEILSENTRTVYRFTADIDGASIVFFVCHLKSGSDEKSLAKRTTEASRIEQHIVRKYDPASQNIILLGDMNTMCDADFEASGTLSYLSLQSNNPENTTDDFIPVNLTELPDAPTYPSYGSILDHILLSPAAHALYIAGSIQIPTPDGGGPHGPSDHYPVMLSLAI